MEQLLIAVAICIFYPFAKQGLQEIILDSASIIAWILGDEVLNTRQWTGICISTVGVILSQLTLSKKSIS